MISANSQPTGYVTWADPRPISELIRIVTISCTAISADYSLRNFFCRFEVPRNPRMRGTYLELYAGRWFLKIMNDVLEGSVAQYWSSDFAQLLSLPVTRDELEIVEMAVAGEVRVLERQLEENTVERG